MTSRQDGERTILLIEEDDETRGPLVKNLRAEGYRVIVALDEEDALGRVEGGRLRADLLLVNLVMKSVDEQLRVGRSVRESAGLDGGTPLVVMPERYGKDVEGTNVNVSGNDWVLYLGEEPGQLQDLLVELTSSDGRG